METAVATSPKETEAAWEENSFKVIKRNISPLPIEVIQVLGKAEYEKRFNVKLSITGGKNMSSIKSAMLRNAGIPATRGRLGRKETVRTVAVPPAPRAFKTNEILFTFLTEQDNRKAFQIALPGILKGVLEGLEVQNIPELKVVYVEDPDPAMEVRVK